MDQISHGLIVEDNDSPKEKLGLFYQKREKRMLSRPQKCIGGFSGFYIRESYCLCNNLRHIKEAKAKNHFF